MSIHPTLQHTFKRGSRTYFYSSVFFPPAIKEDVFKLYAFVRKADDFVDAVPQDRAGFLRFVEQYHHARAGKVSGDIIIDSFVELADRKRFESAWVDAFLDAMLADTEKQVYETIEETIHYMYGSAEVVGLMMARIFALKDTALHSARLLGRAMQYINFIRDIQEDLALSRRYLPRNDTLACGLEDIDEVSARKNPAAFTHFITQQIERYFAWQDEAERGFAYLPRSFLIPVRTASEMYKWTANTVLRDPFVVFQRKVKPSIPRIILTAGVSAGRSLRPTGVAVG